VVVQLSDAFVSLGDVSSILAELGAERRHLFRPHAQLALLELQLGVLLTDLLLLSHHQR